MKEGSKDGRGQKRGRKERGKVHTVSSKASKSSFFTAPSSFGFTSSDDTTSEFGCWWPVSERGSVRRSSSCFLTPVSHAQPNQFTKTILWQNNKANRVATSDVSAHGAEMCVNVTIFERRGDSFLFFFDSLVVLWNTRIG